MTMLRHQSRIDTLQYTSLYNLYTCMVHGIIFIVHNEKSTSKTNEKDCFFTILLPQTNYRVHICRITPRHAGQINVEKRLEYKLYVVNFCPGDRGVRVAV